MSAEDRLLLTGGAGSVARMTIPHLRRAGFKLRLLDRSKFIESSEDEQVVCDLADQNGLRAAMSGCRAVLHLAGCTTDAPWQDQIAGNIEGCIAVFEAARATGVERVIYASSNHVVGMYPRNRRLSADSPLRPDSRYGVTKAFGELLGAFFAAKYGLRVLCIRIGSAEPEPIDRRRLSIWLSPRDFAQLVAIGVRKPDLRYAVAYGVSDNARSFYDGAEADVLGYRPLDRAEDYAAAIIEKDPYPAMDAILRPGEFAQGGSFVDGEFVGSPSRLSEW
ncbi:NAD-dependent epimerase/dehydratase family protein [Bradyrhizobium sp. UFLA05-112]